LVPFRNSVLDLELITHSYGEGTTLKFMEFEYVQKWMLLNVMFSHVNCPRILKSAYGEIHF